MYHLSVNLLSQNNPTYQLETTMNSHASKILTLFPPTFTDDPFYAKTTEFLKSIPLWYDLKYPFRWRIFCDN